MIGERLKVSFLQSIILTLCHLDIAKTIHFILANIFIIIIIINNNFFKKGAVEREHLRTVRKCSAKAAGTLLSWRRT